MPNLWSGKYIFKYVNTAFTRSNFGKDSFGHEMKTNTRTCIMFTRLESKRLFILESFEDIQSNVVTVLKGLLKHNLKQVFPDTDFEKHV
jgi:hypothetical protein